MSLISRKSLKAIMVGSVVAAMTSAAFVAPASAGSFSLTILPTTGEQANAMKAGLQIFSIINAMENGANISQNGMNNSAGIGQNGMGNNGMIFQEGNDHVGTLQQNGDNNTFGIFQFGEGSNVDVVQNGYGQVGTTFVFGF